MTIKERTTATIIMSGGNRIKLISKNDTITKKIINNVILAYVKNGEVYLNCKKFKFQWFYSKCLSNGRYLIFKSTMSNDEAKSTMMFGGAVGGLVSATNMYLNVFDVKINMVATLNYKTMSLILDEFPEIKTKYEQHPEKESESVLIDFIYKINLKL